MTRLRFPKPCPRPKRKPTRIKRTKAVLRRSRAPLRKVRPKAKSERADSREKADREWAEKVKLLAGRFCELGGLFRDCVPGLDAHHVLSKRAYPRLRYDLDNGAALCRRHHEFAHKEPNVFRLWWQKNHPDAWDRVERKAQREGRLS